MMELLKPHLFHPNLLQVVAAMCRLVAVDQVYLDAFFAQWFRECAGAPDANVLNVRKAVRLMMELSSKSLFDVHSKQDTWLSFSESLTSTRGVKEFQELLGVVPAASQADTSKLSSTAPN